MPSTDRKLELQAKGIDVSARLAAVCVCDGPNEAARLAAVGVCERVKENLNDQYVHASYPIKLLFLLLC
jgi:hypothetical protein